MDTLTRAFGAAGGYVSRSKDVIDRLRLYGHGTTYAGANSGKYGQYNGTESLHFHLLLSRTTSWSCAPSQLPAWIVPPPLVARWFAGLRTSAASGIQHTLPTGSPIVPLMAFNPGKLGLFYRMMRARKTPIAVVVVCYPATPLLTSRVRFSVSTSLTKDYIKPVCLRTTRLATFLT